MSIFFSPPSSAISSLPLTKFPSLFSFLLLQLLLVLDLDHTLLNSVREFEVDPSDEAALLSVHEADTAAASSGKSPRSLFRLSAMRLWTKLRPGVQRFLAKASERFELHVCTMGNPQYASLMMDLLDPGRDFFAQRVVALGGSGSASKDLDGLEGLESVTIVVDDTAQVWPAHQRNLVRLERYHYFPASRRAHAMPGLAYLATGSDEPESGPGGVLSNVLAALVRVHDDVFRDVARGWVAGAMGGSGSGSSSGGGSIIPDARPALAEARRQILRGSTVLFSHVIPLGMPPESHPVWQVATELGCGIAAAPGPKVTHVIAASGGTDKVKWAEATDLHVVTPYWLEACALAWARQPEVLYALPPPAPPLPPVMPQAMGQQQQQGPQVQALLMQLQQQLQPPEWPGSHANGARN